MLQNLSTVIPPLIPLIITGYVVGCVVIGQGIFRIKNIFYVLVGCALLGMIF